MEDKDEFQTMFPHGHWLHLNALKRVVKSLEDCQHVPVPIMKQEIKRKQSLQVILQNKPRMW